MALYQAYDERVEVNGETILSVVNAMQQGQEYRRQILEANGLKHVRPGDWYPQQAWLDSFQQIAEHIGERTLFMIGKGIPENAQFPPEIDNLEKALKAIDQAYHMNHRNGKIGNYKLTHFDAKSKQAEMQVDTPYPSEFDRGIIMTMLRKFRPDSSFSYDVTLDETKENRKKGGVTWTYHISW